MVFRTATRYPGLTYAEQKLSSIRIAGLLGQVQPAKAGYATSSCRGYTDTTILRAQ